MMLDENTLHLLARENADLRARVAELEAQVEFLSQHRTLATGMTGERLISSSIEGVLTVHTAPADVVLPDGRSLEVKRARLTNPAPGSNKIGRRWQWQKVFGETGTKNYDHLILIGEADPNWKQHYRDPTSPYVLFSIPFSDVFELTTNGVRNSRAIVLSSNPARAAGASRPLYTHYQTTVSELTQRFGKL